MAKQQTPLEKECDQRLAECRRQKTLFEPDLREAYFFTDPHRFRDVLSTSRPSMQRENDAAQLATSIGMEVAGDFTTEMVNTFMPPIIPWADQKAGDDIPEEQREEIDGLITEQTTAIMDAIKESNLYDTAALGFTPDLSLGTVALWVEDVAAHEPINCQSVPIRELEISVGPRGDIDTRFVVRHTKFRYLPALLPDVEMPAEIARKAKASPQAHCRVEWGFWRDWTRQDDVVWKSVVRVAGKVVAESELEGEGSCPLIVARFNPDSMYAFGKGPAIRALPELRTLDETEILTMESADGQIHPAFVYADDGVLNLSDGIEAGAGYAARAWGAGSPIQRLTPEGNIEFGEFRIAKIEGRIRRMFFVDFPEQAGKTPPTAEQWMDEMIRAKRRIGTPGRVFWKEGPAEVFKRYKFLLEKRGSIEPITVNGRQLALVPYDPTEQAQEHQEVSIAGRIMDIARTNFPQSFEVMVDGPATIEKIQRKLRDKIIVLRNQGGMMEAAQMMGAMQGGGGGAPPGDEGML